MMCCSGSPNAPNAAIALLDSGLAEQFLAEL